MDRQGGKLGTLLKAGDPAKFTSPKLRLFSKPALAKHSFHTGKSVLSHIGSKIFMLNIVTIGCYLEIFLN